MRTCSEYRWFPGTVLPVLSGFGWALVHGQLRNTESSQIGADAMPVVSSKNRSKQVNEQ